MILVGGMICPQGVSVVGPGEVRKNGINITRLSVDQVIFQGYLEGSFFGLRKMGGGILADGSWKGAKEPVHINPIFKGGSAAQAPSSPPFLDMSRKVGRRRFMKEVKSLVPVSYQIGSWK